MQNYIKNKFLAVGREITDKQADVLIDANDKLARIGMNGLIDAVILAFPPLKSSDLKLIKQPRARK